MKVVKEMITDQAMLIDDLVGNNSAARVHLYMEGMYFQLFI